MSDSFSSPLAMVVNRKMRRLMLLPFVVFAVLIASFHKAVYNAARPIHAKVSAMGTTTATVTVLEYETITQQVAFKPEPTHVDHRPLKPHKLRSDGLLEVNPFGRHPIYDLIERAEADWENKLKRQSKTLDEAVVEYQRRYGRAPPKGFDEWWFWCERNNVQLPDEYDRIYHDLEPFWGMDPVDLRRLQAQRESHRDSYTIGKAGSDTIGLVATSLAPEGPDSPRKHHLGQAEEIMGILKEVSDYIPPFRAVFSPHDNPYLFTDWELKTQMLEAAAAGTYVNVREALPIKYTGWPSACAPTSPLRQSDFNLDIPPTPPAEKTFIYDHLKAMDPCNHPTILHHHGQFLSHNQGPTPHSVMVPQFSYSSTSMHHDILPATPINWQEDIPRDSDPEFALKLDSRLDWRGTTTGIWHAEDTRWRGQQRMRLVHWANERNGRVPVLQSPKSKDEPVGEGHMMAKARMNPAMLDIAFVGKPNSCSESTCAVIEKEFEFRGMQSVADAGNYKYVMDVDGHGWSSRFKRLMVSNSLVFKSTVFPEWFQERVQPWVHYIPVQVDLSDLYDSLTFFRGDLNGEGGHEELAAKIALAGRDWSKTHWRKQDMTAYMFRLFLEYSRVMSLDREAASYREKDYNDWER